MSPRARQAPPPVPPAPGAEPPPRPCCAPGSSSSPYNAARGGGASPTAGLRRGAPLCAAAGSRHRPPPPSGPAPAPEPRLGPAARAPEGADPGTRNDDRLPPRPARRERRKGAGAGPAQAPPRRQKMAAWHDPAPRPSPRFAALLGPAGWGPGRPPGRMGAVGGVIRGAEPRNAAQRSSSGHLWLGVRVASGAGRGIGGGERVPLAGGVTPPCGSLARAREGRTPCLAPPCPRWAVGAGAAAVAAAVAAAAPQCGGGAGAGADPGPGGGGGMGGAGKRAVEAPGWTGAARGEAPGVAPGSRSTRSARTDTRTRTHSCTRTPAAGPCRRVLESFASAP